MKLIRSLPGPVLVFLGAFSLSFGGLIIKSFEGATQWQILFWRTVFFLLVISIYLLITYKKSIFKSFYDSGLPGFFGGLILSFGFCGYVFAMYNTSVANTNFIIQTQTIFLAIFGYFFLKEKVSLITFVSIVLGMLGVLIILSSSLSIQSSEQYLGNIVAFIMPISFAVLVVVVRKYPQVDMIPAQFTAGIAAAIIGFFIADKLSISIHDLFLAFLAGFFQIGFGFILITIGSQTTPAAVVGVLMLTESVFGPLWAWLIINEIPPAGVLIGGSIIIFSILFQSFLNKNH